MFQWHNQRKKNGRVFVGDEASSLTDSIIPQFCRNMMSLRNWHSASLSAFSHWNLISHLVIASCWAEVGCWQCSVLNMVPCSVAILQATMGAGWYFYIVLWWKSNDTCDAEFAIQDSTKSHRQRQFISEMGLLEQFIHRLVNGVKLPKEKLTET